jgi:CheY-like chemotaxis protein
MKSEIANPGDGKTILVAEDDDDDFFFLEQALTSCGWKGRTERVKDGQELMNYLLRRGAYADRDQDGAPSPDLVLLDLNMPVHDGRRALSDLKSDPHLRSIPVLVVSTSGADGDVTFAYHQGANAFIQKPLEFEVFCEVVRRLIAFWFNAAVLDGKAVADAH